MAEGLAIGQGGRSSGSAINQIASLAARIFAAPHYWSQNATKA